MKLTLEKSRTCTGWFKTVSYTHLQNNLDETLLKQADAAAEDKIDLFLGEACLLYTSKT